MGLDLVYGKGETPLSDEEKEGLIPGHVSTQQELNEIEQLNIEQAIEWTLRKRFSSSEILSENFIRELHKRMYGAVWRWAAKFRHSDKNIGADWKQVPMLVRSLVDDCRFWIDSETFSDDEIAVRFKHRLVSIHCFPNGNGRHSRLIADIMARHIFRREEFSWGSRRYTDRKLARDTYIDTLREADRDDIRPLLDFARS